MNTEPVIYIISYIIVCFNSLIYYNEKIEIQFTIKCDFAVVVIHLTITT